MDVRRSAEVRFDLGGEHLAAAQHRGAHLLASAGTTSGSSTWGPITTARGTEAVALLVPNLLGAFGFTPFAVSVAR